MKVRILSICAALALSLAVGTATAGAFSPGADSLDDPLFPQIGNGGYDVSHYDIALDYDPVKNAFSAGTKTTISATATQGLSRFSFDFQRDLTVSGVTVDGQAAAFDGRDAKPSLSENPKVTQPAKLYVTPASPIAKGHRFVVEVSYSGVPKPILDAEQAYEGWIHACSTPRNCDGSFVVNEPIGAQSWFPCNNYMTDKATFSTSITVPDGYTALGVGELASRVSEANGTTTWNWTEDDPTATYLTSGTVGRFAYDDTQTLFDRTGGATLPIYSAIDSAGSTQARSEILVSAERIPAMVNFLSKRFGPYPFDSVGYVADWAPAVGYALENETKPHFAGNEDGPAINDVTLLHELAHQWMGDSVTGRSWQQIWFNEGWATFTEVYWDALANDGKQSPEAFFHAVLASKPENFRLTPTNLESAENLFSHFSVYARPGAMIEGYREIVGNRRFFAFAKQQAARHAYSTITERGFVNEAVRASGLLGGKAIRLRAYFRQWLHRSGRPTLTPTDFRRRKG